MNILKNNHPLLNKVLAPIENPDIDKNGGAGLAANQVGIDKRMFVVKYEDYKQAFINPQITWYSDRKLLLEEGCLTYPDLFMNVKRPDAIRMTFIDYEGNKQEEQLFMGVTNRIIQHEYDHMEGKFFWSHLSKVQLDRWNKKLKKSALAA